jgi:TDG/mug DNA glycosylase family protein
MIVPWKPTRAQILAAEGKTVADVIAFNLRVLFSGINPGLYTAAVGHHFARPGNRFWKALYEAGFTDTLLSPFAERELLKSGYGITNVVPRATASADVLTKEEIIQGGLRLAAKVRRYRPRILAVLGVGAYRTAFDRPKAVVGRQEEKIGDTIIWVLPNPSGLNANYQQRDLTRLFAQLKDEVDRSADSAANCCCFLVHEICVICVICGLCGLQVREPPIAAALLHAREPFAQWVKQNHTNYPTRIDHPQTKANSLGRSKVVDRTSKQPRYRLACQPVQYNRNNVRCGPLKYVKEQWHAAKGNECVAKSSY